MQLSSKRQKLQIKQQQNYSAEACSQSPQTSMMTPLGVETSSNMLWSRWREEVEEEGEGLVSEVGSKAISVSMHAGRGRGRLSVNSCCWLVFQENCLALNRAKLLRKTQSDIWKSQCSIWGELVDMERSTTWELEALENRREAVRQPLCLLQSQTSPLVDNTNNIQGISWDRPTIFSQLYNDDEMVTSTNSPCSGVINVAACLPIWVRWD